MVRQTPMMVWRTEIYVPGPIQRLHDVPHLPQISMEATRAENQPRIYR
jgi:hypothetical protein